MKKHLIKTLFALSLITGSAIHTGDYSSILEAYLNKINLNQNVKDTILPYIQRFCEKRPGIMFKVDNLMKKRRELKKQGSIASPKAIIDALKKIQKNIDGAQPEDVLFITELLSEYASQENIDTSLMHADETRMFQKTPIRPTKNRPRDISTPASLNQTPRGANVTITTDIEEKNTNSLSKILNNGSSGINNTAIGVNALQNATTASHNTALGKDAGKSITSGSHNIYLNCDAAAENENYTIRIGNPYLHESCYIGGIRDVAIEDGLPVVIGSNGKLGTSESIGIISGDAHGNLDLTGSATIGKNIYLPTTTQTQGGIYITDPLGDYVGEYFGDYLGTSLNNTPFISAPGGLNTYVGLGSGCKVSSGFTNTGIGALSLAVNENGCCNVASGMGSMFLNKNGCSNVASGSFSMFTNNGGSQNVAIGSFCMALNTTGTQNTAVGAMSLLKNSSGSLNTTLGTSTLSSNTTGSCNIAIGYSCMSSNVRGSFNSAVGFNALSNNTNGCNNTGFGTNALRLCTGNNNIGIGTFGSSGDQIVTGSYNICIGNSGTSLDNKTIRLGTSTTHTQCFIAGIRNSGVVTGPNVVVTDSGKLGITLSSKEYKRDITPLSPTPLSNLEPVSFKYKEDPSEQTHFGLIAEQVAQTCPNLCIYDTHGKPQTVLYQELPALLVAGHQKLTHEINEQKETLKTYAQSLDEIVQRMSRIETLLTR